MDAKRFVAGMTTTLLFLGSLRAQGSYVPPPAPPAVGTTEPLVVSTPPTTSGIVAPPPEGYSVPGVSSWIRRQDPCCSGPFGKNSEIGTELYFRSGPSFTLGGVLGRNLADGIVFQAGARTLFYNHEFTRAWVVEASISDTFNSGVSKSESFPVVFTVNGANITTQNTIREANRTFVNLGGGREWFLYPAKDAPAHLRFGLDGGGRWGSMKLSFNETGHHTDVIGGVYVGTHAMYEFACWNSIVNVGIRTEYSFTWSDVLKQSSDISELNLLFNVGVRY